MSGRFVERADHALSTSNILVSRSAAQRFWPNEDPIGRRVRFGADPAAAAWLTVIGVRHADSRA